MREVTMVWRDGRRIMIIDTGRSIQEIPIGTVRIKKNDKYIPIGRRPSSICYSDDCITYFVIKLT